MKIKSAHVKASQKKSPVSREAHTSPTKKGMGDYYGTGIKNNIGKSRDVMGIKQINPNKLKTPPKSLA
jgi:hypothetical protein